MIIPIRATIDVSQPYMDKTRSIIKAQAQQQNLEEPNTAPRVQIQITEPDVYSLILRIPVPTRKRARLEQDITRRYLQLMQHEEDRCRESTEAHNTG